MSTRETTNQQLVARSTPGQEEYKQFNIISYDVIIVKSLTNQDFPTKIKNAYIITKQQTLFNYYIIMCNC